MASITNTHNPVLFCTALVLFSSCGMITGVKKPQKLTAQEIVSEGIKQGIDDSKKVFVLDDSLYTKYIEELLEIDSGLAKNHYQPLQALYFDRSGDLISFHVNCNAPGFPSLDWNSNRVMETFPPITQTPVDSFTKLDDFLTFINSPEGHMMKSADGNSDFTVIVFWNKFMRRHSKNLLTQIKENLRLNNSDSVQVLLVNNDNFNYHLWR